MSKTRFWVVPLTALIVAALLILGGFAIHHISWSQGYRMGQLAAGGEGVAVVPYAPCGFGHSGLFITIGLLFLLLIVMGKFFRFWAWKTVGGPWVMAHAPWMMAGGAKDADWARHWHRFHGPMPPWCWGWDKPSEEKAEQAGPDAETDAADA
jgi:hypothetical protein